MKFSRMMLALVVLGWVLLAGGLAWQHYQNRSHSLIREEMRSGKDAVREMARRLETSIGFYHGIPVMLAQDPAVLAALTNSIATVTNAPETVLAGITNAPCDTPMESLNTLLGRVHRALGPDIAWVMDTNGVCVAGSNSEETNSIVGQYVGDREYFGRAQQFGQGHQYAMGRRVHQAGLYYATRVMQNNHFAGEVAVKLNVARLGECLDLPNAFVVDRYGVVILASNPGLTMKMLPAAPVGHLSQAARLDRYHRDDFPPLDLTPWTDTNAAPLVHFNHEAAPQLMFSQVVEGEDLWVWLPKPLPALLSLRRDCLGYFALAALTGSSLILLVGASFNYSQHHRQANRQLRAQTELLLNAERIARLGSWNCELPSGRLQFSGQAADIFQTSTASMLDRLTEMAVPEDRDRVGQAIAEAIDRGTSCDVEYQLARSNSGPVIIHLQGRLVKRSKGLPGHLVGTVQDITERKRTERELFKSRETLKMVLDTIPQRVFWKNRDLIFEGCNLPMARDCGLADPSEVIGKSDYELAGREAAETFRALDREVMATDEPRMDFEINQTRPDGSLAYLLVSKLPLHDQEGRVIGVLGAYEDVTERKVLEAQFRQSQKLEAIGRLAGGIAHDFNNLLTVICGYSEVLLQEFPAGASAHDGLTEIRKAGDRAAALTRKLLAFSRKQVLEPDVLDLNALVGDCENMFRRLLGEDIELVTRLAPDLGKIKADASQIDQVLLNLVVNARDAMPRGGRLVIETANTTWAAADCRPGEDILPGNYVSLTVGDTGHGMDAATISHIFEPFYTTKEPGKGTGLGLAMVFGFIKQSGGHISVTSELGRGANFQIHLPEFEDEESPGDGRAGTDLEPV